MLSLAKALRASGTSRIAFTGAGGKTTAVFRLARELLGKNLRVLVTTTTHFSETQVQQGDHHLKFEAFTKQVPDLPEGIIVLSSGKVVDGRVTGLSPDEARMLGEYSERAALPLIIEADGSRLRPVKAPAAHEPVLPAFVDTVVVTAGLSALGRPLGPEAVHRPTRFAALSGLEMGAALTGDAVAAILKHPDGGLKGVPEHSRKIALLNQADTAESQSAGSRMADRLLEEFDSVVVAALQKPDGVYLAREPVAGIVLAAGGSSRMGTPKQMLHWRGKPLVLRAAETALAAGCSPVVVVTGAEPGPVARAVAHLPVQVVHNSDWSEGQSTSVRAGLMVLPERTGGALFLLVDQPFVDAPLLRTLMEMHARSLAPVVAPLIDEQRGNPVLFDRDTFPDFDEIRGDRGGRQLFSRYSTTWVPWHDARALLDVDTLPDYEALDPGARGQ